MSGSVTEQLIFVVHTDSYSGNFEREMCAFLTGQIGDCGVGDDMANLFEEELGEDLKEAFAEIIKQVADEDHGDCFRPCVIWPTPGRGNDGMGQHFDLTPEYATKRYYPAYESVAIFFKKQPSQEMIELMKSRAQLYAKEEYNRKSYHADREPLNIKGFQLLKKVTKVVTETIETEFPI
jgi:hypothetical protein